MYNEDRVYVRETALNLAVKMAPVSGQDPLELAKAFEEWITAPVDGDSERPETQFGQALTRILPGD